MGICGKHICTLSQYVDVLVHAFIDWRTTLEPVCYFLVGHDHGASGSQMGASEHSDVFYVSHGSRCYRVVLLTSPRYLSLFVVYTPYTIYRCEA